MNDRFNVSINRPVQTSGLSMQAFMQFEHRVAYASVQAFIGLLNFWNGHTSLPKNHSIRVFVRNTNLFDSLTLCLIRLFTQKMINCEKQNVPIVSQNAPKYGGQNFPRCNLQPRPFCLFDMMLQLIRIFTLYIKETKRPGYEVVPDEIFRRTAFSDFKIFCFTKSSIGSIFCNLKLAKRFALYIEP